jgi:hypothetical protein
MVVMEKLSLKIADVQIESFEIENVEDVKGTVYGNGTSIYPEISCCCTQDPRDFQCVVSERYCSMEEPCFMTISTTCGSTCDC